MSEVNRMSYREKQKSQQSPNITDHEIESTISELEQELSERMKELYVAEKDALAEEIQWTEERIKSYEEDEQMLQQLKTLKLLDEQIVELKINQSVGKDNYVINIDALEQQLIDGIAKLQIQKKSMLPKEIQWTEERIKNRPGDEQILKQLKNLKLLDERIKKSKGTQSVTEVSKNESIYEHNTSISRNGLPEQCLTKSNDEGKLNKRFWSNSASDQPNKRFRGKEQRTSAFQFLVDLTDVIPIDTNSQRNEIQMKCRRLCGWAKLGYPGTHSVYMHLDNYKTICQSAYMVTWKPVGKPYMMLIGGQNQVYMVDKGNHVFSVDNIQFPYDMEYTCHLKDTLVDGEFVIEKVDGEDKYSFLINDIIAYNERIVGIKPFFDRRKLISQSIIEIRNKAMRKGHIDKTKQPFSIGSKEFLRLSEAEKLLSEEFLETIPHEIDGLFFLPEKDPYMPGPCQRILKWKKYNAVEFRLEIVENPSKKGTLPEKEAHLFVTRMSYPFAKMPYSSDLEAYNNKIISCLYSDGQWHFYQLRRDKSYPNSEGAAKSMMEVIQRSVSQKVLYDLIKGQSA